jgi:hypothetical protein
MGEEGQPTPTGVKQEEEEALPHTPNKPRITINIFNFNPIDM